LSYLNEKWGLGLLESENYNTLGGYLLDLYESIPEKGTVVSTDQFLFVVQKTKSNRLEEVLVRAK
jgi:CBS domain containing-hemolysin-like protein